MTDKPETSEPGDSTQVQSASTPERDALKPDETQSEERQPEEPQEEEKSGSPDQQDQDKVTMMCENVGYFKTP